MTTPPVRTIGDLASLVRSKNAGPFWLTLDIFCDTDAAYTAVAAPEVITPERIAKIIVTHHPFDVPEGHHERDLVERAAMAMRIFAQCGADILLSGHLHTTHAGHSAERYKIPGHSALMKGTLKFG